jgi:hypothetical protein
MQDVTILQTLEPTFYDFLTLACYTHYIRPTAEHPGAGRYTGSTESTTLLKE